MAVTPRFLKAFFNGAVALGVIDGVRPMAPFALAAGPAPDGWGKTRAEVQSGSATQQA
jgi:hypothetical protein